MRWTQIWKKTLDCLHHLFPPKCIDRLASVNPFNAPACRWQSRDTTFIPYRHFRSMSRFTRRSARLDAFKKFISFSDLLRRLVKSWSLLLNLFLWAFAFGSDDSSISEFHDGADSPDPRPLNSGLWVDMNTHKFSSQSDPPPNWVYVRATTSGRPWVR